MRLLPEPASSLPRFRSLVVHGPHPAAAPIHLCLSVPSPHRALLFSPSRAALLHSLSGDQWLDAHSGTGSIASMSSRVTIFYPQSPRHLLAALVSLRTHDPSDPSVPIAPDVTLECVPSLLVLHELSAYFLPGPEEHTVSSYLLLVMHALSTIEFLSSQSPSSPSASLAVFDAGLDRLKLSVLRTPPESVLAEPDDSENTPGSESVLFFVEKYFELSGTFRLHQPSGSELQTPVFALRRIGEDGDEMLY